MNDMFTITRSSSSAELPADVRRDADRHTPIVTRDGYTVLDQAAWEGLMETLRILSDPATTAEFRRGIAEADAGQYVEHDLDEVGE